MTVNSTIIIETDIDYEKTAKLANESFEGKVPHFSESYLIWKYKKAFGGKTSIIAVMLDGQKVGQAAVLWHAVSLNGEVTGCAQLVDLFVKPEFRSNSVVRQIYKKLNELLEKQPDHIIITTPNTKSATLNTRYLKLQKSSILDIRIGLKVPSPFNHSTRSMSVMYNNQIEVAEFIQNFMTNKDTTEVRWTPQSMANRLSFSKNQYVIHIDGPLLAITRRKSVKGIPVFLICGLFTNAIDTCLKRNLANILSAAVICHRRPFFIYVEINHSLSPLPGIKLPMGLRPSQMFLQVKRGKFKQMPIHFDRFEAIDFDFA